MTKQKKRPEAATSDLFALIYRLVAKAQNTDPHNNSAFKTLQVKKGPVMCKDVLLKEICCHHCKLLFEVCFSCFRGQAYCSNSCRQSAREIAQRKYQSKYRKSVKGREVNKLAARRRRIQRKQKTVAEQGSNLKKSPPKLKQRSNSEPPTCKICGCVGRIMITLQLSQKNSRNQHHSRRHYG